MVLQADPEWASRAIVVQAVPENRSFFRRGRRETGLVSLAELLAAFSLGHLRATGVIEQNELQRRKTFRALPLAFYDEISATGKL